MPRSREIQQDDRRRHRQLRRCRTLRRPPQAGDSRLVRLHHSAVRSSARSRSMSARRMKAAIDAVPYAAAVKVGLQFKRRFWEEDDAIYGGISYTDLPIRQIAYPNTGFNRSGRGVLLGAYLVEGANAFDSRRWRRPSGSRAPSISVRRDPSAIQGRVRERRRGGLASRAFHAGLRRRLDRGGAGAALRQSVPDRRPDRAGRRARVLHCRRGRKARSCRRSTPSRGCTSASSKPNAVPLRRAEPVRHEPNQPSSPVSFAAPAIVALLLLDRGSIASTKRRDRSAPIDAKRRL